MGLIPTMNRSDFWTAFPVATIISNPEVALSYFNHFHSFNLGAAQGAGEFNVAAATSGTAVLIDGDMGVLQLAAGAATANQGVSLVPPACPIKLVSNGVRRSFFLEARMKITSPTTLQFFFGLSTRDTTLIASGANSSDNHLGFEMSAASQSANSGKIQFVSEKAGTRTTAANVFTPTAGEWFKIGLVYLGDGRLQPYINGELVPGSIIAANIPDTSDLGIHVVCQANGTTEPKVDIDWLAWGLFE